MSAPQMTFEDLFHITGQDARKEFGDLTYKRLIEAVDDFNAVLKGEKPRNAKFDEEHPLPADGGTSFYRGDGYRLTIHKSLNGVMKDKDYIHGYIYGPEITFEKNVMIGNMPTISFLTFYTMEDLRRLLGQQDK